TLNNDEQWVVMFRRVGDKVFLIRRNVRFTAKSDTPAGRAVGRTYSDSVLMALPIKALNPVKSSVLIDLNPIFFTDFAELGLGMLDRDRTTWGAVKGYKKNLELQVVATFAGGRMRGGFHGAAEEVIDSRGVTVVIHYGLVELPEGGFTPRLADDRVGHFITVVKDFSKESPDTSFVRYANRWRLERADGSAWKEGAKLVPPKKKIVFWIENTVPEEYRAVVREGILEWNKAFEKIGFRDAIEVRQQENEEFDPEDMSYATFRWITRDQGFAIGPSRANPLTGEILDADILFDSSMVRFYKQEQRLFRDENGTLIEPASDIQAARRGWEVPRHPFALRNAPDGWADPSKTHVEPAGWNTVATHTAYCQCAAHKRGELALAMAHAAAAANPEAGGKVSDELLQQAVKETTMHEVGHTLGLRHNFKASTVLPNEKLHDTAITRKQGLVGSVMDYTPANIAPKGTKQGDYFTSTLGAYDYWAIEYAYKPLSGGTDGEAEELKKIASKVAAPDLIYGTDEDLMGTADPLVNVWDLGSDPVKFAAGRVKLAQDMTAKLADTVVDKGEGYQRARQAFGLILRQYGDAAFLASKQVGGVYLYRDHKGDPNGRDSLVPVPAEKQRAALKFLQETVLTDKSFAFPPELLRKLGADRWWHWGNEMAAFAPVDVPVNERILAIQLVAMNELLDGDTLSRIQNSALSAAKDEKPLAVAEVFRAVSDSVFADLPPAAGKAPAAAGKSSVISRNLQRAYLSKLSALALGRPTGGRPAPADAKSLARLHLGEAGQRIDAALKAEKDDTARAHLAEAKERITKVLTATVTATE
ncbi:MAG: zinc-dependent metalloprotease, partial [Fimbriiglobus sp.]